MMGCELFGICDDDRIVEQEFYLLEDIHGADDDSRFTVISGTGFPSSYTCSGVSTQSYVPALSDVYVDGVPLQSDSVLNEYAGSFHYSSASDLWDFSETLAHQVHVEAEGETGLKGYSFTFSNDSSPLFAWPDLDSIFTGDSLSIIPSTEDYYITLVLGNDLYLQMTSEEINIFAWHHQPNPILFPDEPGDYVLRMRYRSSTVVPGQGAPNRVELIQIFYADSLVTVNDRYQ